MAPAAWLTAKQRIPIQTARPRIRHARALRTLPAVEAAWAVGEIDRTHLITLMGVRTPRATTTPTDRPPTKRPLHDPTTPTPGPDPPDD